MYSFLSIFITSFLLTYIQYIHGSVEFCRHFANIHMETLFNDTIPTWRLYNIWSKAIREKLLFSARYMKKKWFDMDVKPKPKSRHWLAQKSHQGETEKQSWTVRSAPIQPDIREMRLTFFSCALSRSSRRSQYSWTVKAMNSGTYVKKKYIRKPAWQETESQKATMWQNQQ